MGKDISGRAEKRAAGADPDRAGVLMVDIWRRAVCDSKSQNRPRRLAALGWLGSETGLCWAECLGLDPGAVTQRLGAFGCDPWRQTARVIDQACNFEV